MKRAASWFLCCVLSGALLAGCGMFGDSRLYAGLLGLCAKCHVADLVPSKATLLEIAPPGPRGPAGSVICPTHCTFSMGHGTIEGEKP